MPTFEVFLSLFFLFHFFLCMFAKNYTSIAIYEKSFFFSLYTYIPIHEKNFFLYIHMHWKTLSLYTDMVYIKPLFLFKDFFFLFQYTLVVYTKKSLYTLIAHIQEFLFTHCLYTKTLFTHFLYTKNFFSFLYIHIWHFVHNASFFFYSWCYHDVCSFYFRTTFQNENSTRFQNLNKHYRQ